MADYQTSNIRNIALLGHGSEGKTTLAESMLLASGAISRQGRVEDGSATTDFDPEEQKRHISISAATAPIEWKGVKINVIDVPGYFDFIGEVFGPLRVAETAGIVVGAVSGLTVGAEKAYDYAEKYNVCRMFIVNRMDTENASYTKVVDQLREKFGDSVVPLFLPIGEGAGFKGIVNVLENKAYEGSGKNLKEVPVPADMASAIEDAMAEITEAAAAADDELMEIYLDTMELTHEQILTGFRAGMANGTIVPVVCCSAITGVGIAKVLDTVSGYLHAPSAVKNSGINPKTGEKADRPCDSSAPFSALVYKTIADPFVGKLSLVRVMSGTLTAATPLYNVNSGKTDKASGLFVLTGKKQTNVTALQAGDLGALSKLAFTASGDTLCDQNNPIQYDAIDFPAPCISKAVYAAKQGEEDKVFSGLARLQEEDPSAKIEKNEETAETIISGQGEQHLEVLRNKLLSKFGANANFTDPRIAYRESIRKPIDVEGRHKKQTGGHGQFGDVKIRFRPNDDPTDTEFHFVDSVVGGTVPRNFIPAVEKGLRENIVHGVLAGFPVVSLTAELYDGSYHPVDSSEMAFKTAARLAFKQLTTASPMLLEPIMHVEVFVPDEYMGDIMGDMNKRRGRIMGMDKIGKLQRVTAEAPMGEMMKYATDLRSMTQARGSFTMKFERYEEMPADSAKKVIESAQREDEEEE